MHGDLYQYYVVQRFHHKVSGLGFLQGIDNASAAPYELLITNGFISHLLIGTTRV